MIFTLFGVFDFKALIMYYRLCSHTISGCSDTTINDPSLSLSLQLQLGVHGVDGVVAVQRVVVE